MPRRRRAAVPGAKGRFRVCVRVLWARPSQYYIKPTKQREGARSNKTFYTGVREVETVMARVLDEHKNVGFG